MYPTVFGGYLNSTIVRQTRQSYSIDLFDIYKTLFNKT